MNPPTLQDVARQLHGRVVINGSTLSSSECPCCGGRIGRRKRNRRCFYVSERPRGLIADCKLCHASQREFAQALGLNFVPPASRYKRERSYKRRGAAQAAANEYLRPGIREPIEGLGSDQAGLDAAHYAEHRLASRIRLARAEHFPWDPHDLPYSYRDIRAVFQRTGKPISQERVQAAYQRLKETFVGVWSGFRIAYLRSKLYATVNFSFARYSTAPSSAGAESRRPEGASVDAPRGPPRPELAFARAEVRDGEAFAVFSVPEVPRHSSRTHPRRCRRVRGLDAR